MGVRRCAGSYVCPPGPAHSRDQGPREVRRKERKPKKLLIVYPSSFFSSGVRDPSIKRKFYGGDPPTPPPYGVTPEKYKNVKIYRNRRNFEKYPPYTKKTKINENLIKSGSILGPRGSIFEGYRVPNWGRARGESPPFFCHFLRFFTFRSDVESVPEFPNFVFLRKCSPRGQKSAHQKNRFFSWAFGAKKIEKSAKDAGR